MKYIIPIEPKPQSRPRFTRQGRTYELKEMTDWKRAFSQSLRSNRPKMIEKGPVTLLVTFYVFPPQSISKIKTKRQRTNETLEKMYVEKRPDLDNYIKAVLDASNGILFKDDGQIAVLSAQKLYSLNSRIELEIEKLEETK